MKAKSYRWHSSFASVSRSPTSPKSGLRFWERRQVPTPISAKSVYNKSVYNKLVYNKLVYNKEDADSAPLAQVTQLTD